MEVLKPGHLLGHYEIRSFVAKGGTALVYKALDHRSGAIVALKVVLPSALDTPELLTRFLREGAVLSTLEHRAIVEIHEVGEKDGQHYMAMEYLDGRDLMEIVGREGPLPPGKALRVCRQAAEALDFAHARGVVHRDIKPANIVLTKAGQAKVTDFGICRQEDQNTVLTQTGAIIGTPAFMSPEQCRGDKVDLRSDLFSLGSTLYTLLSGELPFQGTSHFGTMDQIVGVQPKQLSSLVPNLPRDVYSIVWRLMAKKPEARYQTAGHLARSIDKVLEENEGLDAAPKPRVLAASGGASADAATIVRAPEPKGSGRLLKLLSCGGALGVALYAASSTGLLPEDLEGLVASLRGAWAGPAEGQSPAVPVPAGALEDLDDRLRNFERCLVSRRGEVYAFISPGREREVRARIRSSLFEFMSALDTLEGELERTSRIDGPDDTSAVWTLEFQQEDARRLLSARMEWALDGDGGWHLWDFIYSSIVSDP